MSAKTAPPLPLKDMLATLEVGGHPSLTNAAFRHSLQQSCGHCTEKEPCRHWLEAGGEEGPPAFCPNAVTFSAMQAGLELAED